MNMIKFLEYSKVPEAGFFGQLFRQLFLTSDQNIGAHKRLHPTNTWGHASFFYVRCPFCMAHGHEK